MERSWGPLGALLEASWGLLGASWTLLGRLRGDQNVTKITTKKRSTSRPIIHRTVWFFWHQKGRQNPPKWLLGPSKCRVRVHGRVRSEAGQHRKKSMSKNDQNFDRKKDGQFGFMCSARRNARRSRGDYRGVKKLRQRRFCRIMQRSMAKILASSASSSTLQL